MSGGGWPEFGCGKAPDRLIAIRIEFKPYNLSVSEVRLAGTNRLDEIH